jgi:hypothetical protein
LGCIGSSYGVSIYECSVCDTSGSSRGKPWILWEWRRFSTTVNFISNYQLYIWSTKENKQHSLNILGRKHTNKRSCHKETLFGDEIQHCDIKMRRG